MEDLRTSSSTRRFCRIVLAGLAGLGICGCGAKREHGTLSGKVTFQGKAVAEGVVAFYDDEYGAYLTADIQPDGTYKAGGDKGIWAGKYRVAVVPPRVDAPKGISKGPPKVKEYPNIPVRYRRPETSRLAVEVKEGSNEPFDIEMK
jgi:hypothetical protein